MKGLQYVDPEFYSVSIFRRRFLFCLHYHQSISSDSVSLPLRLGFTLSKQSHYQLQQQNLPQCSATSFPTHSWAAVPEHSEAQAGTHGPASPLPHSHHHSPPPSHTSLLLKPGLPGATSKQCHCSVTYLHGSTYSSVQGASHGPQSPTHPLDLAFACNLGFLRFTLLLLLKILRYNSYTIKFTLFYNVQFYRFQYSQELYNLRTVHHLKKNKNKNTSSPLAVIPHLYTQLPAMTNLLWSSMDFLTLHIYVSRIIQRVAFWVYLLHHIFKVNPCYSIHQYFILYMDEHNMILNGGTTFY